MFDRAPMLGQVPISEGAGFGGPAWSVSTPLRPGVSFPPPPGAPMATEENTGPWLCPDGVERVLTAAQARAMGCTRRTLMGRRPRIGQNGGGPGGGPAPSPGGGAPAPSSGFDASVTPAVVDGGVQFSDRFFNFPGFFPGYFPGYYPPYYPPQGQRLVCRRLPEESEDEGRDVLDCQYQPAAPAYNYPAYNYPAYPAYNYPLYTYPVQQYHRPLNWWWWSL